MQKELEIFNKDEFATNTTGIEIVEGRAGYGKVKLTVEQKHFNAVGIVQGGVLFTLADFAFAIASNAGRAETGESTVATDCLISFLKPTTGGVLYAEAVEQSRSKSLCLYDITVKNEISELVAKFTGRGFIRKPRT